MARPKLPEGEAKHFPVTVRLNEDQNHTINNTADMLGISRSELIAHFIEQGLQNIERDAQLRQDLAELDEKRQRVLGAIGLKSEPQVMNNHATA